MFICVFLSRFVFIIYTTYILTYLYHDNLYYGLIIQYLQYVVLLLNAMYVIMMLNNLSHTAINTL